MEKRVKTLHVAVHRNPMVSIAAHHVRAPARLSNSIATAGTKRAAVTSKMIYRIDRIDRIDEIQILSILKNPANSV